jgi:hypothetical protein
MRVLAAFIELCIQRWKFWLGAAAAMIPPAVITTFVVHRLNVADDSLDAFITALIFLSLIWLEVKAYEYFRLRYLRR